MHMLCVCIFYHFNERPLSTVLYALFLCLWWNVSNDLNKRLKLELELGKIYIQTQFQIDAIYAYTSIYSIFTYVFGTIAIKMATKLIDTYSLISTMTLTPKFQSQMINCL